MLDKVGWCWFSHSYPKCRDSEYIDVQCIKSHLYNLQSLQRFIFWTLNGSWWISLRMPGHFPLTLHWRFLIWESNGSVVWSNPRMATPNVVLPMEGAWSTFPTNTGETCGLCHRKLRSTATIKRQFHFHVLLKSHQKVLKCNIYIYILYRYIYTYSGHQKVLKCKNKKIKKTLCPAKAWLCWALCRAWHRPRHRRRRCPCPWICRRPWRPRRRPRTPAVSRRGIWRYPWNTRDMEWYEIFGGSSWD